MKKLVAVVLMVCATQLVHAQVRERIIIRNGTRRMPNRERVVQHVAADPFKPYVSVSVGYGFPNLDKDKLVDFIHTTKGNTSQTGPFTAAVDYRFNRRMSLGIMGTYGKVSVPYYDNFNIATPAFTGSLKNWSVMLNMKSYLPGNKVIDPYIRTAIGVNIWADQKYVNANGQNVALVNEPTALAYQVGLGATFHVTKNTGLFVEAGYGKYIVSAGLSFKL